MGHRRTWTALLVAVSMAGLSAVVPADAEGASRAVRAAGRVCYRVVATDISPLRGFSTGAVVNDRGEVAGNTTTEAAPERLRPFVWRHGRARVLRPAGNDDHVTGLNERGQLVGYAAETMDGGPAYLWSARGKVTPLGSLAPAPISDTPNDINDRGDVVGVSMLRFYGEGPLGRAFRWRRGVLTDLGSLGGAGSEAVAVNASGLVIGTSDNGAGQSHAFSWTPERGMADLGTLGGPSSRATGVNDRGQIVGVSATTSGDDHAFLWQRGRMTDLGTLGGTTSGAAAVNNRGHVVGASLTKSGAMHGFLWRQGAMTDLGVLPGGTESMATGVNDHDQVIGYAFTGGTFHPFLWQRGVLTDLGRPGRRGGAADINNDGLVTGSLTSARETPRAMLWRTKPRRC